LFLNKKKKHIEVKETLENNKIDIKGGVYKEADIKILYF